jgi:hypothetical protein
MSGILITFVCILLALGAACLFILWLGSLCDERIER